MSYTCLLQKSACQKMLKPSLLHTAKFDQALVKGGVCSCKAAAKH